MYHNRVGIVKLLSLMSVSIVGLSADQLSAQAPIPVGSLAARLEPLVDGLNGVLAGNTANERQQFIPIDMAPMGDGRQLILTLGGHVRLLQADGTLAAGAYLDTYNANSPPIIPTGGGEITDIRQIGNTSIATHPGFADPQSRGYGRFYVLTSELPGSAPADFDDGTHSVVDSVVTEWTVDPAALATATQLNISGPSANVTQREILRSQRPGIIHTLVDMAFATDETLILTSGDGGGNAFPNTDGSAFNQDRFTNSLDARNIFGSVLRIDPLELPGDVRPVGGVNGLYRIPLDNFGLVDGDPDTHAETFAIGLRSPYRINVDQVTGRIFVGDVGEGSREEINIVSNGGNYGWGAYEGTRVNRADLLPMATNAVGPLFELYHNLNGQSESTNIVGGFVYRGSDIPDLQGQYVFADVGENNGGQPTNVVDIYYGDPDSTSLSSRDDLFRLQIELPTGIALPDRIWSIAEDENGELYILAGPDRLDLFNRQPGETDGGIWRLTTPTMLLNGIAGDVNQDGFVNGDGTGPIESDDVSRFVQFFMTSGYSSPFEQYIHGDMNFDGITDVRDWFILTSNHEDASGLDLANLLGGHPVPEPRSWWMALAGVATVLATKQRVKKHFRVSCTTKSNDDPRTINRQDRGNRKEK
jgi:glucose/arabinose dehydrogenase